MHSLIRGWRRNLGCVTLLMGVAVLVLWVRSHIVLDFYSFTTETDDQQFRRQEIGSFHGNLCWRSRDENERMPSDWLKLAAGSLSSRGYLDLDPQIVAASHIRQLVISHLAIVMLLNLLSAYLILWKPRRRESCPDQPISARLQLPTRR